MEISTNQDEKFGELLEAVQEAKLIGTYIHNTGMLLRVYAGRRFMLISDGDKPTKIAFKAAQSERESENMALEFLQREKERGSDVDLIGS